MEAVSGVHDNELSFAMVHKYVFAPRCVKCHTWCATCALVKGRVNDIERMALKERTMPKDGPLSAAESELLARWISAGAPEDPKKPDPPVEPLKPTFESIKRVIFLSKCIDCHSLGQPGFLVPLNTKEDLIDSVRELVLPGNPDESGLMISITRKDDKKMPPSPSSPLTNDEIAAIHKWILDGAN